MPSCFILPWCVGHSDFPCIYARLMVSNFSENIKVQSNNALTINVIFRYINALYEQDHSSGRGYCRGGFPSLYQGASPLSPAPASRRRASSAVAADFD